MHRTRQLVLTAILTVLLALAGITTATTPAAADATYSETVGGNANTWTDYNSAGGTQGQTLAAYATVQIACKLPGFRVADGNTWWYRIASAPWSYAFYVSADAFYNNGATSGSLAGTPFVDPTVPDCDSAGGIAETAGGAANTWTDYTSAGGTAGPQVASRATVRIACKLTGFRVADGNTWWYRIASGPWNNGFYVSADAFYNNGATSGSIVGTPWVDSAVPDCASSSGGSPVTPTVSLAQGPAAPSGYRYAISVSGFAANTSVKITCFDSVSTAGFYTFTLKTNSSGAASTQSQCYSGDGPDHWVVASGRFSSNPVQWGNPSSGSPYNAGQGTGMGSNNPGPADGGIRVATSPGSSSGILLAVAYTVVDGVTLGTATNKWHPYGPNNTCWVQDYNSPNNGHLMLIKYDNGSYHVIRNGMLWGWWDLGGASGQLGCPVTGEQSSGTVNGHRFVAQQFDRGWLYWTDGMDHAQPISFSALEAIGWAWQALGTKQYAGMCLAFAYQSYAQGPKVTLVGGPTGDSAMAYQWWTSRPATDQHPRDFSPPPGAFAIWNPSAAVNGAGHIAVSIGAGWAVSTETTGRNDPVYLMRISDWLPSAYYGWVTPK